MADIASNRYNLQAAAQPGRGIYPDGPTHFFECTGPGLKPNPTMSTLNISDGRMWTKGRQRVTYIENGGTPDLVCQPDNLGFLLWAHNWALTTTPGTPNVHAFTPPTSLAFDRFVGVWQYFDGEWWFYPDCQFLGGQFTVGVDTPWMLARPNIISLGKVKKVAAPTEATEETDDYGWIDGGGMHYIGGDYANRSTIAVPTDLTTLKADLASFKTIYNLHCAVATGLHHKAADATNTLGFSTPLADLAACIAALTEIRTDLIAHEASETVHYFADTTDNNPGSGWAAPCTTLAECLLAAQDLLGAQQNTPGCYNRHLGAHPGARSMTVSLEVNASPIQGESVTPYRVKVKPSGLMVAQDVLQEDFRYINLAVFGDPDPAAGTEQTTEIQHLSLWNRYESTATDYVEFSVPQFDFDPTPLSDVSGAPGGDEIIKAIGGAASGEDPLMTITVANSDTY